MEQSGVEDPRVGISDAGLSFESDTHWQQAFADYSRFVLPSTLIEQRINCGNAPMWGAGAVANRARGLAATRISRRSRTVTTAESDAAWCRSDAGVTVGVASSRTQIWPDFTQRGGQYVRQIAAHESPRTAKLYDRRSDELTLDDIERIEI
jgi:hypothetical protein